MRKTLGILAVLAAAVLMMTGCGNSTASNEYIEIKQLKGLEIEKVDGSEVTDDAVEDYIENKLATLSQQEVKTEVPDRTIKKGDTILLDCSATGEDGKGFNY